MMIEGPRKSARKRVKKASAKLLPMVKMMNFIVLWVDGWNALVEKRDR